MIKPAYYNEFDLYAAQWIRNLIDAGLIAPGDVDTRDIRDVKPDDLKPYAQCHFFAGLGGWSYALRLARWPDDRPIWSMSCPCQPFSEAGEGAGFADERHLWPHAYHLVTQRRPAIVVGEQVASRAADAWIDLVQTDLEAVDYSVGAVPFPSAGVGAPHIRDRLYWGARRLGDADDAGSQGHARHDGATGREGSIGSVATAGLPGGMANTDGRHTCAEWEQPSGEQRQQPQNGGAMFGLADATSSGRREEHADHRRGDVGDRTQGLAAGSVHGIGTGGLGDADSERAGRLSGGLCGAEAGEGRRGRGDDAFASGADLSAGTGPINGVWRNADWLLCRDGKWRPVEPSTFPLAHGAAARVGRLRAYGNAINVEAARVFIDAFVNSEYTATP